jgi:anti-anti-sigma factor
VLEVAENEEGGVLILRIKGRLDAASSPLLERKISGIVDEDQLKLLMDFEGVEYLSSAGMRLLLNLTKRLKSKQGKMAISAVNRDVMEVIKMAGFDHILEIFENEKEALTAF